MAPLFKPLIFTFMTLFSLWGGTIQDDKQFQDAVISMGKEDKLVLMIYTTDSCPECAYMKQKVFTTK
jgi:thioredoxin-related protein